MKLSVQFKDHDPFLVTPGREGGVIVVTLGKVGAPRLAEFVAFGVTIRVLGDEIPSIEVAERDFITYTAVFGAGKEATALTERLPEMPACEPALGHCRLPTRCANLVVAVNERTGQTWVLKNRFGDEGVVRKAVVG